MCQYHKNDLRLISVIIFLKSGISVYHKAIVKDLAKEIDPGLLSSFLQAISAFGKELINEQISLIRFQKMNIVFCRGEWCNGAIILKGKINEETKKIFSYFLQNLEDSFKDYFKGEFNGRVLPEHEVDKIAFESMKGYAKENFYCISPSVFKKSTHQMCGVRLK